MPSVIVVFCPRTYYPYTYWLETTHLYYVTVSVGRKSESNLAVRFRRRIPHEVSVRQLLVSHSSEVWTGAGGFQDGSFHGSWHVVSSPLALVPSNTDFSLGFLSVFPTLCWLPPRVSDQVRDRVRERAGEGGSCSAFNDLVPAVYVIISALFYLLEASVWV